MIKKNKIIVLLTTLCMLALNSMCEACTLFSAVGDSVQGGGTLIGKNNDVKYEYINDVEFNESKDGFDYFIICPRKSNGEQRAQYGINEYGLAIVVAGTSNIMSAEERSRIKTKGGVRAILSDFKSVDDLLKHSDEYFTRPNFFIVADANEIACIEVGLDSQISIQRTTNGVLGHANHFLNTDILNGKEDNVSKNSFRRQERIMDLLENTEEMTIDTFKRFANDEAIFRNGSAPNSMETNGQMVMSIQKNGNFTVYMNYKPNSSSNPIVLTLTRKDLFGY